MHVYLLDLYSSFAKRFDTDVVSGHIIGYGHIVQHNLSISFRFMVLLHICLNSVLHENSHFFI